MDFSKTDLLNLAFATSEAAQAAYTDERLVTAHAYYDLSARLWAQAGHPDTARQKKALALACLREKAEALEEEMA